MPWLAEQAHILSGIVIQHHTNVMLALVILFNAFDSRGLSVEGDVHYIAARARMQAHAASRPHLNTGDIQVIDGGFLFEELPFPLVHCISSLSGRRFLSTPWSFINCSTGMLSVRSSIFRARSSD